MCCKNRPLALFGACLAITAATASALSSSHSRDEAVPQVAPQADELQVEPKQVPAPTDQPVGKTADERKSAR
jgi:hypothetical protein